MDTNITHPKTLTSRTSRHASLVCARAPPRPLRGAASQNANATPGEDCSMAAAAAAVVAVAAAAAEAAAAAAAEAAGPWAASGAAAPPGA